MIGVLVYDLFVGDVLHARDQATKPPEVGCTRPVTSAKESVAAVSRLE
ncbi:MULTISPECIES: hypothetical protein [Streptomyces]|uniref:Uncharacterized protein n=1 Tax=Streptomyces flaveolus TaxID=67297 RepID=A0ABV3AFF1_9ACTN|nr:MULTISPECIES: hypothetical protein [Streptomyces]